MTLPHRLVLLSFALAAVTYQVVLTKVDKLPKGEVEKTVAKITEKLKKRGAAHPVVRMTSAEKGFGIPELRAEIAGLAALG